MPVPGGAYETQYPNELALDDTAGYLELLDWRRHVSELYVELRRRPADDQTLAWFREEKDRLYRDHPQSPIPAEQRRTFGGLAYWPFDPGARVVARLVPGPRRPADMATSTHESMRFVRLGELELTYQGQACALSAFWLDSYAGGLFVAFRDATSGRESYGGGRYLLDTSKGADLGSDVAERTVVLDFNYAFHPSCTYDPRWMCPLAPPENRLPLSIRAGERLVTET